MLKKCLLTGLAVILLVSIGAATSCNGYPQNPEDVVKEAYRCMSNLDYDGCKRLFAEDAYFPTEEEFRDILEYQLDFVQSYEYYEVQSVEIEGDEAFVTGTVHFAGGTESDYVYLVKEDGLWKIYE